MGLVQTLLSGLSAIFDAMTVNACSENAQRFKPLRTKLSC
jgi:hypothetical protein